MDMSATPQNATSEKARRDLPNWSDRAFIETNGRAQLSDDFIHDDRRPIVALPRMGPDEYVANALTLFELYDFEMWFDEVVAVRGQRLALMVRYLTQDDWEPVRSLAIVQFDAEIDLVERWVRFDAEQLDDALAVLDQMGTAIDPT